MSVEPFPAELPRAPAIANGCMYAHCSPNRSRQGPHPVNPDPRPHDGESDPSTRGFIKQQTGQALDRDAL